MHNNVSRMADIRKFFVLLLVTIFLQSCAGGRIVVTYAVSAKSHAFAVMPLVEKLAENGHQVTVVSPFQEIANNVKNRREILLTKTANILERKCAIDWFAMQRAGVAQQFSMLYHVKKATLGAAEEILTHPEFKDILKKRDVDLFIVDGVFHEFLYPVFYQTGIPFIAHLSSSRFTSSLAAMGAPFEYASVPAFNTDFSNQMTFLQRLVNILTHNILNIVRQFYILKDLNAVVQTHFPGVRSIAETEGEASLFLLNTHPMTSWARSLPPSIIPIGAMHTKPARALPTVLQEFADEAKNGLIIFSLGSFISVSSMSKDILASFIRVFSKLPQRIIWKWEDDPPPNISANVLMVDWLPQQDLLGKSYIIQDTHANTRVFISHGGLLGTQEAAYHGVPIFGLPFGNDQRTNIAKATYEGWGIKLDWDKVDDRVLFDALEYLIKDPNIQANSSRVSRILKDELVPPKDLAAYWVEYVLRHGGTKHLQMSSKNMPFYQRNLIDVGIVLFTATAVVLFLTITVIRFAFRKCFTQRKYGKSKKKN